MDIRTTSRILEHSWVSGRKEYKLVLEQHFDTSPLTFLITMCISEEIVHRLRSTLHLAEGETIDERDVHCLIESKDAFIVEFELGGCFPVDAMRPDFPKNVTISGKEPEKAPGLSTIFLYSEADSNGNSFFQEYFLSKKYFDDLTEAFYQSGVSDITGLDIRIDENGKCYCQVRLPAKNITAEAIFIDDGVASKAKADQPVTPPTSEEFFTGK